MKTIEEKLSILADSAKYDVSCASSGSFRPGNGGLGSAAPSGICHAWGADGRCISLLKVLFTNACIYDCAYCRNRRSNDIPRASFTVQELADLTINFYRRNYIEGLFLSSAVFGDPEYTMSCLYRVIKSIRTDYGFGGYIHVKAIPGASQNIIEKTGFYADRMSVNIELPTEKSLLNLAPEKSKKSILGPMGLINDMRNTFGSNSFTFFDTVPKNPLLTPLSPGSSATYSATASRSALIPSEPKPVYRSGKPSLPFIPAGQSTQLVLGASPEDDLQILRLSEGLYNKFGLKRVYYSAYVPVNNDPRLPQGVKPPLLREHRLYQADWLLRFYGFTSREILSSEDPFLAQEIDPKIYWALRNFHLFPIEVVSADYYTLLRIPGIGVISARRILAARRSGRLDFEALKRAGVVLKRAQFFITCRGRRWNPVSEDPLVIRACLADKIPAAIAPPGTGQLELF